MYKKLSLAKFEHLGSIFVFIAQVIQPAQVNKTNKP